MQNSGKGFSIAGMVLGIVATIFAWFAWFGYIALACGIVGIICAAVGRKKAAEAGVTSGIGTAGLVLSIIGTTFAAIGVICCTICYASVCAAEDAVNDAIDGYNW